jgi:hypothetical protein
MLFFYSAAGIVSSLWNGHVHFSLSHFWCLFPVIDNETHIFGQYCLEFGHSALGTLHAIRCAVNAEQKTFGEGARLFCDFPFGGKPAAVALKVIQPGNGKDQAGKVRVKLTETVGAYRKDEELEISTFQAVPKVMERKLKRGEFFRRVSTLYRWE